MFQKLFTCLAALSLLVGIVVGAAWVRSYFARETLTYLGKNHNEICATYDEGVLIIYAADQTLGVVGFEEFGWRISSTTTRSDWTPLHESLEHYAVANIQILGVRIYSTPKPKHFLADC